MLRQVLAVGALGAIAWQVGAASAEQEPGRADAREDSQQSQDEEEEVEPEDVVEEAVEEAVEDDPERAVREDDLSEEPEEQEEALPPPPPPVHSEQLPVPVLREPAPVGPLRSVELGMILGVAHRPAKSDEAVYSPGLAAGGYVRIPVNGYVAGRVVVRHETHVASLQRGALGLPGAEYDETTFGRTYLGALVEPTWRPARLLRLWLLAGVGWARTTVGEISSTGDPAFVRREVAGVFLEFPVGVGGRVEVVPDWLAIGINGYAGFLFRQSGVLFEEAPAVDASGAFVRVGPLPMFDTSLVVLSTIGLIL